MYATNICKACLRVNITKSAKFHFYASRRLLDNEFSGSRQLGNSKSCISCTMSYRSDQTNLKGFLGMMKRTSSSTHGISPNSVEDVDKMDESTKDSLEAVTEGPPEELMQSLGKDGQRKLQVLWMELEMLRQSRLATPKKLSLLEWQDAMEAESRSQRLKFYRFLCIKETLKENDKRKKRASRLEIEKIRAAHELAGDADASFMEGEYGPNKNTIFRRIDNTNMSCVYNSRQCHAIQFGQSIVIDLGLDEHMVKMELSTCANQIKRSYGINKKNRTLQILKQYMRNLYSRTCMITVTEKSYLDIFPKEKLVYLTPHCKNDLANFDHDAIYIIGGIVDKCGQKPVSAYKAKSEGIAMARLPLDKYLEWSFGTKSLTLDQMMEIMLGIKNTGSWNRALQHVPKRKLQDGYNSVPDGPTRFRHRTSLFDE